MVLIYSSVNCAPRGHRALPATLGRIPPGRWLLAALLACLLALTSAAAGAVLPAPVERILRAQRLPESAVSILVTEAGGAEPLLSVNPELPRAPASTIKLVTTYVALELLGPTYSWPTKVYALGSIVNGTLEGDLVIKGFGDPYLVEEDYWKLLAEIRRAGIRRITGDLVIDDSHFAAPKDDAGAFDGQAYRQYNVLPNAFLVNFKAVNFEFAPAADGKRVVIGSEPELPNLKIENDVRLTNGACGDADNAITMTVPNRATADRVIFSGNYPKSCGTQVLPRTALTPAMYAFGLFQTYWKQWGGTIDGKVRRGYAPPGAKPLVIWYSRPLHEIIRPLNKWSNNIMADAFFYTLAGTANPPPLAPEQGAAVVRNFFAAHHIDASYLVLENGSGLSRKTRITAENMMGLLQHAWAGPYMPEFLASLPLAGLDGTLRKHFKRQPEAGRIHAKTGLIDGVVAIAGYVRAKSGRTFCVVLFVNHPLATNGSGRLLQDAVLRWAFEQ